ncbi:LysR family transcriptional regulator [Sphingomonas sp. CJ99]
MEPPVPTPDRSAPAAAPPARRARWTPARQRIFLVALSDTGSIAAAARAAGLSRSSAHRLRARLAGTPFDIGWDRALALYARRAADPFAPDRTGA